MSKSRLGVGLCFCAAAALVWSVAARAETVTLSGVAGVWSDPTATSPAALAAAGVTYSPSHDRVFWGDPASSAGPSSLLFTGRSTPATFETGDLFDVGTLTHVNNPIYNAITSVKLTVSLAFSTPALGGSFPFAFAIDETPNSPSDLTPDDDFIRFGSPVAATQIRINDTDYTLQLLGFRQRGAYVTQFTSAEQSVNTATLVGRLTSDVNAPVPADPFATPLPSAALAGFTLLGGLGLTRGRRTAAE